MANVNITEREFELVVGAAWDAKAKGRHDDATALDKLARKMNAALTNQKFPRHPLAPPVKPIDWREVPSVFEATHTESDKG